MKKTSLLIGLLTITLALSVGACSQLEVEDKSCEGEECLTDGSTDEGSESKSKATTPMEFIEKANLAGNYTALIYVDEYISNSYLLTDIQNDNYDEDELYESMEYIEYVIMAYYTEDALLVQYCYSFYSMPILMWADLYINESMSFYGNIMDYYYTYDLENWISYGSYYGHWQDNYGSLFDNYYYGLRASNFSYVGSGYDLYDDYYEAYSMTSTSAEKYLGYMCGYDLWNYYMYYYLTPFNYVYFYPEIEELCLYYYSYMWYTDSEDDEYVYLCEDDFYVELYNVGSTDISSYVRSAQGY